MEFGRVATLDGVDFHLPGPDPRSRALLAGRRPGPLQVRVGQPRWTSEGATPPQRLGDYAERYTCIELNVTFHTIPEPRIVAGWAAAVPAGFRFCPKVPRAVSHAPTGWEEAAQRFAALLPHFGNTLGPCFFQAPPEVGPEDLEAVLVRMRALPAQVALEVRHPAFFRAGRLGEGLFSRLAEAGIGVVVTDTPGRRDVVHRSFTSPTLILRFGGHAGEPSTRSRLEAWATLFQEEPGLQEVYLFVHQPDNLRMEELAEHAQVAMGAAFVPPKGPRQRGLFGCSTKSIRDYNL